MKISVVAAMKKIAAENLKLKDVSFVDFESIDAEVLMSDVDESQDASADVDVIANLKIGYDGEPPESYRVLNGMLQDWVDDHKEEIRKLINPKLLPFLKEQYKDVDLSDLKEDLDDYVWEDQVDYLAEIDEDKKEILFTVELSLEVETSEEDDD